jgi:hypothetical protein
MVRRALGYKLSCELAFLTGPASLLHKLYRAMPEPRN